MRAGGRLANVHPDARSPVGIVGRSYERQSRIEHFDTRLLVPNVIAAGEAVDRQIIELVDDVSRPGVVDTPKRAAVAMEFMTRGYDQTLEEVVNEALFLTDNREMIIVQDIELYSLCEHHMLPFIGRCHVGYIPDGRVLGLSKVARIVDMFARRLQIQEELTYQIATALQEVTGAADVGVVIEAKHLCMMMRGVQKQNSAAMTSCLLGGFRDDPKTRNEFLGLVRAFSR